MMIFATEHVDEKFTHRIGRINCEIAALLFYASEDNFVGRRGTESFLSF
jgi:hypothetical protein